MANQHGDWVWYELMTPDSDGAQAFYAGLLGWSFADSGQEGVDYRMFSADEKPVGGTLQLTPEMIEHGAHPSWVGYIRVDDAAKAVASARASGANVLMEGNEVPGVGPFAMLQDPEGAALYVIEDRSGEESHAFSSHEAANGTCAWNELMAADPSAAMAFYGSQFGWVVADSMDMGEMGKYEMLKCGADRDFLFGGLMRRMPEMPVSAWAFYFRVPLIDAAVEFVTANGGQVINGPMEIPGGEFVLNGIDPHGAMFSLIGKRES